MSESHEIYCIFEYLCSGGARVQRALVGRHQYQGFH